MKRVFVIAMDSEAAAIVDRLESPRETAVHGRRVVEGLLAGERTAVVVSGIGKVNAAAATELALARYAPELIVNAGVAGAIDPAMKVGELYSVDRVFQCDFDLSGINPAPKGSPDEYDSPWFDLTLDGRLPFASCATGDAYDNEDRDIDFVRGEMGASLRDMELGAIAHVCRRAGVPVVAVKSVSDVHVGGNVKPTVQYTVNLQTAIRSIKDHEF